MVLARNAEATQQRLIDAALELYAQRGYVGTCLDAILQRASSSKGAFYHHFDSKEDLTARALELHWENFISTLQDAWNSEMEPAKKLDKILELLSCRDGLKGRGCPLGLLGFESRCLPPQVQEILVLGLSKWSERVAAMLAEIGLNDRQQAETLAQHLFIMFEGGILIEHISGSFRGLESSLAAWRRDVLAALRNADQKAV